MVFLFLVINLNGFFRVRRSVMILIPSIGLLLDKTFFFPIILTEIRALEGRVAKIELFAVLKLNW